MADGVVSSSPPSGATAGPGQFSLTTGRALRVSMVDGSGGDVSPSAPLPVTAGAILNPSSNFTRPNDTTQYASGDLVANSTSAGSVTPLSWANAARTSAGSLYVRRVRLFKSGTGITDAYFRVHFYASSPAGIANGDNAAWSTNLAGYCGAVDVIMSYQFVDGAGGLGFPVTGSEIDIRLASGTTIYALLEARNVYVPGASEVFTCIPEIVQY